MIKMRTKEEKDSEQWATNSSKVHLTNKISCQKTLLPIPYLQAVMKVVLQSLILNNIFFSQKTLSHLYFNASLDCFLPNKNLKFSFQLMTLKWQLLKLSPARALICFPRCAAQRQTTLETHHVGEVCTVQRYGRLRESNVSILLMKNAGKSWFFHQKISFFHAVYPRLLTNR